MAEQHRMPPVPCDLCGGTEADGIDEHGRSLCPHCAGRMRGDREGEARGLGAALGAVVAAALLGGLSPARVREVVESEIAAGGELANVGEEEG
jgi:hypothetical protein